MKSVARAPGTCGELIQGIIKDINFHVTSPIDLYSIATVELSKDFKGFNITGGYKKAEVAVQKLLSFLGAGELGGNIHIESSLPQGKGMASSTADITAVCIATADALGRKITPQDIACIALSVEPTDGLMFPGIVAFDHVQGRFYKPMSGVPEIDILIVDTGGTVDTGEFNSRVNLKLLNRLNEDTIIRAFERLEKSIENKDLCGIGESCTTSSLANQKILEKDTLPYLHEICCKFGGLGVNVAHSGTVVGMLFPRDKIVDWATLKKKLVSLGNKNILGPVRLISGGADIWREGKEQGKWIPYYTFTEEISGPQYKSME